MIPFASQRGLGQDLATHLMNEYDNEYMELADVRGAVASDLHGAFAEWEAQAHALTKCRDYLYSFSVNPLEDGYGRLTREQHLDYIDRVEEKLGLSGQPRLVVFHIKDEREHCHVVWSRIDVDQGKAVQMAFDHDKLMMVTRQFARDHHPRLPDGYEQYFGQGRFTVRSRHARQGCPLHRPRNHAKNSDNEGENLPYRCHSHGGVNEPPHKPCLAFQAYS